MDSFKISIVSLDTEEKVMRLLKPYLITKRKKIVTSFSTLDPNMMPSASRFCDSQAVIVVHPPAAGRIAFTDVDDSYYTKFLQFLEEKFEKKGICIIAYGLREYDIGTRDALRESMRFNQPTMYDLVSTVILCAGHDDLLQDDVELLHGFLAACGNFDTDEFGHPKNKEHTAAVPFADRGYGHKGPNTPSHHIVKVNMKFKAKNNETNTDVTASIDGKKIRYDHLLRMFHINGNGGYEAQGGKDKQTRESCDTEQEHHGASEDAKHDESLQSEEGDSDVLKSSKKIEEVVRITLDLTPLEQIEIIHQILITFKINGNFEAELNK